MLGFVTGVVLTCATTGTGTLSLGAAASPYLTPAQAGMVSGNPYSYSIVDSGGAKFEAGWGTWTSGGTNGTLTRNPRVSSSSNAAINCSGTNMVVRITPLAEELGYLGTNGWVNKFRNPNFDINQRGTSGTITAGASAVYTLDGWMLDCTGANVSWLQGFNADSVIQQHLKLSCATGITGCTLTQRVESYIAAQLLSQTDGAQNVTVKFTIFNNSGASFTPQIKTGFATAQDNFGTVTTDLAATNLQACPNGVMTVVAYTFAPSNANPGLRNGYQVQLLLGAALNQASGYVDVFLGDLRATPALSTGLNANPAPAETRPLPIELLFCQRYFCSSFVLGTAPAQNVSGQSDYELCTPVGAGATARFTPVYYPTQMRAAPTITFYNPTATNANVRDVTAGVDCNAPTTQVISATGFDINVATAGGTAVGDRLGVNWSATAEL